jgi:hypothetical protein
VRAGAIGIDEIGAKHAESNPNKGRRCTEPNLTFQKTTTEPNPVNSTATRLDALSMKDHHHIARPPARRRIQQVRRPHGLQRARLQRARLYTRNYKGLAPCLNNAAVFSGKPTAASLRSRVISATGSKRTRIAPRGHLPPHPSKSYRTSSKTLSRVSTPVASSS